VSLIAIAPTKFARGVEGPASDWRVKGGCPTPYESVELTEALERTYATDAHLVAYTIRSSTGEPLARQPRINKGGLPWVLGEGFVVEQAVFFCDVDNPDHAPWTLPLLERAIREYEELEVLRTAGVYHTQHGRRIVQPLATPIPVTEVEPYLHRWLLELESAGLPFDRACRDWTRHFRLPHVRRGGQAFRSPWIRLERMTTIALTPMAPTQRATMAVSVRADAPPAALEFKEDLPENWSDRAVSLAKAIRAHVVEGWHDMYLALGGALLRRGLAPERLPTFIGAVATAAGSEKPQSHADSARDTAQRYAARIPCTGFDALRRRWPEVADALEDATATGPEARTRAQARENVPVQTLAETVSALEGALRDAPDGLSAISAECGLGKTEAAIRVAAARSKRTHTSPSPSATRAPLHSKTSISVDKNVLAEQIVTDLRAQGVEVKRVFGPLSLLRDDGTPECRFHGVAEPLVEGGQAMQWLFCEGRKKERCEFYDECSARKGFDGPASARVTIGPHALLGQLDAAAGSTGLLIIDEPPPFLETIAITKEDFHVTFRERLYFNGRYTTALTPVLQAVRGWVHEHAEPEVAAPFEAIVRCAADAIEPDVWTRACRATGRKMTASAADDAIACAKEACPPALEALGVVAPPLEAHGVFMAKRDHGYARRLGTASRVLGALYRVVKSSTPVSARVEERRGERVLLLTMIRAGFDRALRREGSVVVTDANARVHLPILEKAVGYAPAFHEFAATDGARIDRTLLRCRSGTRKAWLAAGKVRLDVVLPSIRAMLDWVREDHRTQAIGVITFKPLREVLEAGARAGSETEQYRVLCKAHGIETEHSDALVTLLAGWDLRFGHYGAVRGLNNMADVDAVVTLGDPWPHVGEVRNEVAFLGLDKPSEERLEELCRAELEQAHGRIRAVHRKRAGRALHVGAVLPSGSGWASGGVEIRKLLGGRVRPALPLTPEEVRAAVASLGGPAATSRTIGCTARSLFRYLSGERAVPDDLALLLRLAIRPIDSDRSPY
jgi:hypothetical protein